MGKAANSGKRLLNSQQSAVHTVLAFGIEAAAHEIRLDPGSAC